jgi:hypothetical protein
MEPRPMAYATRRAFSGAFYDYVRGVFADHSARSRLLRAKRSRWLRRIGRLAASAAEQRWEGEGGSTR